MLTLLNSESLWIGTDMKLFNRLREQLEQAGITYKHKVKNRMGQWAEAGPCAAGQEAPAFLQTRHMNMKFWFTKMNWNMRKKLQADVIISSFFINKNLMK